MKYTANGGPPYEKNDGTNIYQKFLIQPHSGVIIVV